APPTGTSATATSGSPGGGAEAPGSTGASSSPPQAASSGTPTPARAAPPRARRRDRQIAGPPGWLMRASSPGSGQPALAAAVRRGAAFFAVPVVCFFTALLAAFFAGFSAGL